MIELTASDGHKFGAYRADPDGKPRGGVVVLQEIFGANAHIRAVADRLAAAGYLAIAPALFDRAERDADLSYTQESVDKGRTLLGKIPREDTMRDVDAAIKAAQAGGKAGLVGFCWGGTLAWLAAAQSPGLDASVGYYGGGVPGLNELQPKAPIILHFGETDGGIPLDGVRAVEKAHPDVPVYVYAGAGHAFNRDADPTKFHAGAAKLAWERTLDLFARKLG